jgi:hypothetical protein
LHDHGHACDYVRAGRNRANPALSQPSLASLGRFAAEPEIVSSDAITALPTAATMSASGT